MEKRRKPGAFVVDEKHLRNVRSAEKALEKIRDFRFEYMETKVIESLRRLEPFVFEEVVLSALRLVGADIVRNPKYSGDHGIDGRFFWPGTGCECDAARDNAQTYAVQCKRVTGEVRVEGLQDFVEAVTSNGYLGGIFVHTGWTSRECIRTVQGTDIVIVSGTRLVNLILGQQTPASWNLPQRRMSSIEIDDDGDVVFRPRLVVSQ